MLDRHTQEQPAYVFVVPLTQEKVEEMREFKHNHPVRKSVLGNVLGPNREMEMHHLKM